MGICICQCYAFGYRPMCNCDRYLSPITYPPIIVSVSMTDTLAICLCVSAAVTFRRVTFPSMAGFDLSV